MPKKSVSRQANDAAIDKALSGKPIEDIRRNVMEELIEKGLIPREMPSGSNEKFKQPRIIKDNILNFGAAFRQMELDQLTPYMVLVEGMMTATVTRKRTITFPPDEKYSEVRYRDVYEEVPDWPTRKEIARSILSLCGADPRLISRIEVDGQTGTVNLHIGNLYAEIGKTGSKSEALQAYNELKEMEQRGEVELLPLENGDELIAPSNGTTAPIGAVDTDVMSTLAGAMNLAKAISSK